jgi:hypothetical protein
LDFLRPFFFRGVVRAVERVVSLPRGLEIAVFGAERFLPVGVRMPKHPGRRAKWYRDLFASCVSHNGGHAMPLKKPLPILVPQRLRRVPRSFAWIDHRLRSEGFLERLRPEDLGLYLFLALAADRSGLSCWRLDRIQRAVPCFDRYALCDARRRLAELDLISYRPWRHGELDGCYQVLSVERLQDPISPELRQVMSKVFQRLEASSVQP